MALKRRRQVPSKKSKSTEPIAIDRAFAMAQQQMETELAAIKYERGKAPDDGSVSVKRWERQPANECCRNQRRSRATKRLKDTPKGREHLRRQRISRIANSVRTRSAIVPQLFHLLRRFYGQVQPGNVFEKSVFRQLASLSKDDHASLQMGLSAFSTIDEQSTVNLFDPRFSNWSKDQAVSPDLLYLSLQDETARWGLGRSLADLSHAGKVRPWEQEFATGDNFMNIVAPWPWINEVNGLRTATHRMPILNGYLPEEYQTMQEWVVNQATGAPELSPSPTPARAPGCQIAGHMDNFGNCLRPASARLGERVVLTGINFFSISPKVMLTPLFGGPSTTIDGFTIADDSEPGLDLSGDVIADHRVRDQIMFDVPEKTADELYEFPIGFYRVEVVVANDIGYTTPGGDQPPEFRSNLAFLSVLPKGNESYRIWSDLAHCYDPTDGEPGSDEICLQAFRGTLDTVTGEPVVEVLSPFRWDGVEAGDTTAPHIWDLLGSTNSPATISGAIAIGLIGWEVDSEDALDEQIRGYGAAFEKFWKIVWKGLTGAAAGGIVVAVIGAILAKLALWVALIVIAIVLVITLVVGLIWAAWAPPDQIAFDVIATTESDMLELTKPTGALPSTRTHELAEGFLTTVIPQSKLAYLYTEERQYECPEEGSLFGLQVRYQRDT